MSELKELKKELKRLDRKKKKTPGDGWFKIILRQKIQELENKQNFAPPVVRDECRITAPSLAARGFFCSGPDLPGSGKRIIVRYNLTQCPDLQPPKLGIIVRFMPSWARCPVPWFGFRGTIVRVRVWASLPASLPGHLFPTLLYLQPKGIRTIVRFFYTQIFLLPQNPNKKKLQHQAELLLKDGLLCL